MFLLPILFTNLPYPNLFLVSSFTFNYTFSGLHHTSIVISLSSTLFPNILSIVFSRRSHHYSLFWSTLPRIPTLPFYTLLTLSLSLKLCTILNILCQLFLGFSSPRLWSIHNCIHTFFLRISFIYISLFFFLYADSAFSLVSSPRCPHLFLPLLA